jgi:hypothetical protein
MTQQKLACPYCGESYWPRGAWQHDKCKMVVKQAVVVKHAADVVVKHAADVVVKHAADVVVKQSRMADRHKQTPERAEYMRNYMRDRMRRIRLHREMP